MMEMKGKLPMNVLDFVNLFFAGSLAGMEIVVHYGLPESDEIMDEQSQIRLRQALIRIFRVLVPAFFLPGGVSGIAVTALNGTKPGFWFRGAGVLSILTWIFTRVVATAPTNSATADWDPTTPPEDWKAQVNHAERFHIIGTWAAIMAFVFFLLSNRSN